MDYRYLGSTGIQVSKLCMGTMTFGREADRDVCRAMFARCLDAGINFFDCANIYAGGDSERILGDLIADSRDELVITSKVYGQMGTDPTARGSSRRNIMAAVEASLKRLRTDHLDIYFLHNFDEHTPLEESLRALEDLVRQGKVRYSGASNFAAWQYMKALGIADRNGWARLACIQPMYNLVKRQAEVEILPFAQAEGVGVISYSPLGGGVLTGKYHAAAGSDEARLNVHTMYAKRYSKEWYHECAAAFVAFAREHELHPVSLAVAWAAAHPAVTAPIIGARSIEQLEPSLQAIEIDMTAELYAAVSALSPTPPPAHDRLEEQG